MNNQNIKVYLGISFALIFLLILIIIIPFSKKPTSSQPSVSNINLPVPTSVSSSGQTNNQFQYTVSPTPISIPATFTGAIVETLPPEASNLSTQKKDLRSQVPKNFGTFSVDFDYNQDKFIVTLNGQRDQALRDFNSWRSNNYPSLGPDQFLLK